MEGLGFINLWRKERGASGAVQKDDCRPNVVECFQLSAGYQEER
jgi:hypothetical protein